MILGKCQIDLKWPIVGTDCEPARFKEEHNDFLAECLKAFVPGTKIKHIPST